MAQKHRTSSPQTGNRGQGKPPVKANSSLGAGKSPQQPAGQLARQARSRFSDEYGVLLNQLITARKAAGVTQVDIADRLGKTQSHVSMCENREREISIIDLWRWCAALNIKVSDFLRQFEEAIAENAASRKSR